MKQKHMLMMILGVTVSVAGQTLANEIASKTLGELYSLKDKGGWAASMEGLSQQWKVLSQKSDIKLSDYRVSRFIKAKNAGDNGSVDPKAPKTTSKEWKSKSFMDHRSYNMVIREAPKGRAVFLHRVITSEKAQAKRIHITTPAALEVWINGKSVFVSDGKEKGKKPKSTDVKLSSGKNDLLIKLYAHKKMPLDFSFKMDDYHDMRAFSESQFISARNMFPMQMDWVLQDYKPTAEWELGMFDGRGFMAAYLTPRRDASLEKELLQSVIKDLAADARSIKASLAKAGRAKGGDPRWLQLYEKACQLRRTKRLKPLLAKTNKVIFAKHQVLGKGIYVKTETEALDRRSALCFWKIDPKTGETSTEEVITFEQRKGRKGKMEFGGMVRDLELSFDGKKLLFAMKNLGKPVMGGFPKEKSDNFQIYEMDLATKKMRQLTGNEAYGASFEPVYLPSDEILFSSSRIVQHITCGWGDCSNLFIMNRDGKYARRVGFDQTNTAFQTVLENGKVLYTRRDYNDRGQNWAHALFQMNPDGTMQTEYYGNNTFEPTSFQHSRGIPGTKKVMTILGGYHTSQGGKLAEVDISKGRQNVDGVDLFPGGGKPKMKYTFRETYGKEGDQYSYPYPLDEDGVIVSYDPIGFNYVSTGYRIDKVYSAHYGLYFMTRDGQRELLDFDPETSCMQAIAVMPRKRPSVRASSLDYAKKSGNFSVQDVYHGPSMKGIKRGTVKKLRVVELLYKTATIGSGKFSPPKNQVGAGKRYGGGGNDSATPTGVGSASFDAKKILGEVDVHADGSVSFEAPARVPLYFQLIDANGDVVQTMRSWTVLMPGESFSCVGCHEENETSPLSLGKGRIAMRRPPQKLTPVYNISGKPFSYVKSVQPILDKHCVKCHAPGKKAEEFDLSNNIVIDDDEETGHQSTQRKFYQSYLTLLKVKRHSYKGRRPLGPGEPNEWVDYFTRLATLDLTPPYYTGAAKSGMMKLLRKGHHKVNLDAAEMGTLSAWIDLNVPFVGDYNEMNTWNAKDQKTYATSMSNRKAMEELDRKNIDAYIQDGQPTN